MKHQLRITFEIQLLAIFTLPTPYLYLACSLSNPPYVI